jgi:hypothetical protein
MIIITMNTQAARAAGYRALTGRFYLPGEQEMLDGVLADMRRGRISHVLVKDRLGVSVWRRGSWRTATMRTVADGQQKNAPHRFPSPHPMGRGNSSREERNAVCEGRVGKKGTQVENLRYSRLGGLRYERASA